MQMSTGTSIANITEIKSTYIMIKFTLQLDDIRVVPGLLLFLQALQHVNGQENWSGRQPGNEANTCVEPPVSLCKLVLKWLHVEGS